MSVLSIRRLPDPLLHQPTRLIQHIDEPVRRLIDQMISTMRRHPRCVGLAAPQVGSDLRIAVVDTSGHPKAAKSRGLLVLVNPAIDAAEGMALQREGCLSIPDFTADVRRAKRVHLRAFDASGTLFDCWLEGFEAIVAQHELDHLDGTLFLDRVANLATDVFKRKSYL